MFNLEIAAAWAQILSLGVAAIALIVQVAAWLWPNPNNAAGNTNTSQTLGYIRRYAPYFILVSLSFWLGTQITAITSGRMLIESTQFTHRTYSHDGGTRMDFLNVSTDTGGLSFIYSGYVAGQPDQYVGNVFDFREPLDLTSYNYIEFKIDSQSPTAYTITLSDTDKGADVQLNKYITNLNQTQATFKVPLASFERLNTKYVRNIGWHTGSGAVKGNFNLSITGIKFTK